MNYALVRHWNRAETTGRRGPIKMDQAWWIEHWAYGWILANFLIYLAVFVVALCINHNFNIIMVGMIYLLPLIPFGWESAIEPRFVVQSIHNMVFGIIELVIFVDCRRFDRFVLCFPDEQCSSR
jgi:hypothetical protein